MFYNSLKIIHIISAALLLASMGYSYWLWKSGGRPQDTAVVSHRIQIQTWLAIAPLAIFQLATGFTMISLQQDNLSSLWISCAVIGFVLAIGGWFSFLYFLLLSQQVTVQTVSLPRFKFFRRAQSIMLSICALALLGMIFLMANKTS
jgi:uncharacterized membrane protein